MTYFSTDYCAMFLPLEGALSTDCERPERLRNMESSQRNRQTSSRTKPDKTTVKSRGNTQKATPVSRPATHQPIGYGLEGPQMIL